jgi:hypothetical protein
MGVRYCVAAALVCCAFSLNAAMVPGEPPPDLVVRDASGSTVRLSAYRQKKHIALLAVSAERIAATNWTDTNRRLAPLDTVLLFNEGPAATVLIDQKGIVRRVLGGRVLTGAELESFVELWQSGKGAFAAYCARCHGEEGDAVWCDPKPLTGLGQRMSTEQVRETLHMTDINDEVIIRGERIKKLDIDAIVVYVRSL